MVPAIEALRGPLRPAAVGRHLAGVGGRRLLRRRGGGRQRHQRLRRPRLPRRVRGGRAPRWWPPTSGWRRGCPIPSPSTTTWWPTVCAFLADRAAAAPRRPASRPSGSWSTPGSTSARPSRSRSILLRPRIAWPTSATRCSCPRRTSGSSGSCSTSTSTGRPRAPWPPTPSGVGLGCRVLRCHDVARRPAGGRRHGRGPGRDVKAIDVTGDRSTPPGPPRQGRRRRAASATPSATWSTGRRRRRPRPDRRRARRRPPTRTTAAATRSAPLVDAAPDAAVPDRPAGGRRPPGRGVLDRRVRRRRSCAYLADPLPTTVLIAGVGEGPARRRSGRGRAHEAVRRGQAGRRRGRRHQAGHRSAPRPGGSTSTSPTRRCDSTRPPRPAWSTTSARR